MALPLLMRILTTSVNVKSEVAVSILPDSHIFLSVYDKFWIIVPNKLIEKLKWKEGEELEAEVKNGKLVVEND